CDLAIIDKRRPKANVAEVMNIIGEVNDRTCVIMDDIVDTAGTLCKAASALKNSGAKRVLAYCTHAVLSGAAISRLNDSELDELVVTNTIPLGEDARACTKIRQISVASLLADTMLRISNEESVSTLFME
ncbi:MAG: ribose-phosphate diphosphokinase, partial [Rhodocyclaceae bacterium]|nr:ribose-phosphate diphosphokinase [Rhodocyclaceae bacterium]